MKTTQTLLMIYSQPTPYLNPMAPLVPTLHATTSQLIPRINQPRGHLMNYTNTGSMDTKMKTDTKQAKIKYLVCNLFYPFLKDKIRIKVKQFDFVFNRNCTFIHSMSQFNNPFSAPSALYFSCTFQFPTFPCQFLIIGSQIFSKKYICFWDKLIIINFQQEMGCDGA